MPSRSHFTWCISMAEGCSVMGTANVLLLIVHQSTLIHSRSQECCAINPKNGKPNKWVHSIQVWVEYTRYHKALYLLLTWNTAKLVQRGTRMVLVLIFYKYWYQIHCLSEMDYIYTVLSCWGNHSVSFSQHLAIWDNWIWGNTIFKKFYLGVHSDFPSSNEMRHTW